MLHPDKVRERLHEVAGDKFADQRLKRIAELPKPACEAGRILLHKNVDGKSFRDWQQQQRIQNTLGDRLDGLSVANRLKLFNALFPKLGKWMELAWELQKKMPYQMGYSRKCFREPTRPEATRSKRSNWLQSLMVEIGPYDPDIEWIAIWAGHLYTGYGASTAVTYLLASAMNEGGSLGDTIFDILKQSASNQHEIGCMGHHVTRTLLMCDKPEAWEFMEKFLLAAQRQEGLRQNILEAIDESHPQAFRRMLKCILDNNLVRFSATVRAVNVWFGFLWDSVSEKIVKETLQTIVTFFEDSKARDTALTKGDGTQVYLALWTFAFDDVVSMVSAAQQVIQDPKVERRFAAVVLLNEVASQTVLPAVLKALDDSDLRIATRALNAINSLGTRSGYYHYGEPTDNNLVPDMFERLERLLPRYPEKPTTLKPLVWPWTEMLVQANLVADGMFRYLGNRSPTALIPYMQFMSTYYRAQVVRRLAERRPWTRQIRETLFALLRDKNSSVREAVVDVMQTDCTLEPKEAEQLEELMTKKSSSTRRSVLRLLMTQNASGVTASADRLLDAKNRNQRVGGLSLLCELAINNRGAASRRARAEAYRIEYEGKLTDEELTILDTIERTGIEQPTLDNALGLLNPAEITTPPEPKARKVTFMSSATVEILKSLDALVEENRETVVIHEQDGVKHEWLLGNQGLPSWNDKLTEEENLDRMPLREVWEEWLANRPKKLRDKDGLELFRANLWISEINEWTWNSWKEEVKKSKPFAERFKQIFDDLEFPKLKYSETVANIIHWLLLVPPKVEKVDYLLDAAETALSFVPESMLKANPNHQNFADFRYWNSIWTLWFNELLSVVDIPRLTDQQAKRLWELVRWYDHPRPQLPRNRTTTIRMLQFYDRGLATQNDLLEHLLGSRGERAGYYYHSGGFEGLHDLTQQSLLADLAEIVNKHPELKELITRCRDRVLEVELGRGDLPIASSLPARAIQYLEGTDLLLRLLHKLGNKKLDSGSYGTGRPEVLTYLIQVTHPSEHDTKEDFSTKLTLALKAGQFNEDRLIELGFVAPQWLPFIENHLNWPGMTEAVWWFLYHTPSGRKGVSDSEAWDKIVKDRTAISDEERNDGAVDAAWFHRVFEAIGPKRWQILAQSAKYGCQYGQGAKKAIQLAEVLRGRAKKGEIVKNVRKKFLRESVRLLGLLPLSSGAKRETDLMHRYKVLQEYARYARSLSPMSREGAIRTAQMGIENLARTGGYPDPIRLEWAMEAKAIADLAQGPISRTVQGVTVTLMLDAQGQPEVTVNRGDKPLKSIPAPVRKDRKVRELTDRKQDLRRQASRMKGSLEGAMLRGDGFTGAELQQLFEHPMLVPLLERLVLMGENILGYPVKKGKGLLNHTGKIEPIKKDEVLRIAHPHDLLQTNEWHLWQAECFQNERIQPFKQVFRELYVPTEQEKADGDFSSRYAGQQVNPSQANALWGARGWGTREEVRKRFHEVGITAEVSFRYGYGTPLEVEGLTLDAIRFYRRGESKPMKLEDVPPRIFSEVMRDCDLVVSVAHRGGVDPEASQSTVEMRAALLRETCSLLKMNNVRFQGNHVMINGEIGNYSIHLGSAVVHKQPGGSLCIIPVGAQHRGRLFLPFADEDPKTAEVISKTMLLARDNEIQDPAILDQIRSR